ncbi:glycosyltransferase family 29 protein [Algoriphagus chordae]|uniref:Glycosyl transferase family 29 (Putative sialyltransferase) n=1 Tax=Algoriphagus chordae TaxID=237019 RepID=A0A2W7QK02_9BACT|nr:glycosyltransferase family 29 protein [Algoriphagus chordae]PZX47636.1 glycosyl transferase family 29 (putative sialyltransferase) [Algoriphagus chordae]
MSRVSNYLRGLGLLALHFRAFDFSLLKGKRVAIVGPADSAYSTGLGEYIDGFDFVVRVNRAPYIVATGKSKVDIGTRTDILFHSFHENDESGGGILDFEMYKKQSLKYLINPRNNKAGIQMTFNFYKKYPVSQKVFTLPKKLHQLVCEPLDEFRPTIGYLALMSLLHSAFSELYITGFTFYKTDFGAGYRDHIKTKEAAKDFIKKVGVHDIDKEYNSFLAAFKTIDSSKITLDPVLFRIIQNEGIVKR